MKTKLLIGLGILMVFILGLVAGAMGSAFWFGAKMRDVATGKGDFIEKVVVRKVAGQLDLDEEQKLAFQGLVAEAREEIRPVQRRAGVEVRMILEKEYGPRVRAILDEEQAVRFDRWIGELPPPPAENGGE